MSSEGKVLNSCSVFIMLMEKNWKFLQPIMISYDLNVCRDLDSRSFRQVQCHWKKTWEAFTSHNAYNLRMIHDLYLNSFIQVQGHWKIECIVRVYSNFSNGEILEVPTTHKYYL